LGREGEPMESSGERRCGVGGWFRRYHLLVLGLLLAGMYLFGLPAVLRPVYGPLSEAERLFNPINRPELVLRFWHGFGVLALVILALGAWDARPSGGRWAVEGPGFPFWVLLLLVLALVRLLDTWWWVGLVMAIGLVVICLPRPWERLRDRWHLHWLRLAEWEADRQVARHPWLAMVVGGTVFLVLTDLLSSVAWVQTIAHGMLGHMQARIVGGGWSLVHIGAFFLGFGGVVALMAKAGEAWESRSARSRHAP